MMLFSTQNNIDTNDDMQSLWRSLVLFSHGKEWPDDISKAVEILSAKIEPKLSSLKSRPSFIESRYANVLASMLEGPECILVNKTAIVSMNENLHGFEADIVARITEKDAGKTQVVNIEIDGVGHNTLRGHRFSSLRDKYLTERHNVLIVRIKLEMLKKTVNDAKLKDILYRALKAKNIVQ
jgi:hypothetical protein